MATYFHGNSEIQGDGLQTLILMNPNYVGYGSDTQQQHHQPTSNFVFLNSAAVAPSNLSHAPPNATQHFVGIPLPPSTSSASRHPHPPPVHSQQTISALHGLIPYNINGSVDSTAAREVTRSQQGLSLSLSSQQTTAPAISPTGGSPSPASGISNGVNGVQSMFLGSKYLKAAQELLDEVVHVGKGIKCESNKETCGQSKAARDSPESVAVAGEGSGGRETNSKHGIELTTAERQEIQMKKAKLVNMLDEVEQRYRQYRHQMQIVISWFEQAAGIGSARSYTALALQTISKQFRCLKDAIVGQIRAASSSLGEEDCFGGGKSEGSRLKFVDHQLRQQRALQQLGMIQPNAWRPQRGLPERAVSVLRAWLFEHFLHPYPKDSDKLLLAKQTGLTRSQVSNWFINARVRLWKPMVEEMYTEEIKEHEQNRTEDKISKPENSEEFTNKPNKTAERRSPVTDNQDATFNPQIDKPPPSISASPPSTSPSGLGIQNPARFTLIGSSEIESITQGSPKKQRSSQMFLAEANNDVSIKSSNERYGRDGFTLMGAPTNFIGEFGSYPMGPEQFQATYTGNAVSLTLGLPHCENLSMSGTHQAFLPNQSVQMGRRAEIGEENEFGSINTPTSHSTNVYNSISLQGGKRFVAQLLPDFVA
ncbi:hypothetical protein NMG60_11008572 [Bertholletia excelsa]